MMMVEAHVGEVSRAVLAMQTGPAAEFNNALWEATRLSKELTALLEALNVID